MVSSLCVLSFWLIVVCGIQNVSSALKTVLATVFVPF